MTVKELAGKLRQKYGPQCNAFRTGRRIQVSVPGHMIGFGRRTYGRIAEPGDDCPSRVPCSGNAGLRHTGYAYGSAVFCGSSVIGLATRLGLVDAEQPAPSSPVAADGREISR